MLERGPQTRLRLPVLQALAPDPGVQLALTQAIEIGRPNVVHSCLIALGHSGNRDQAD